MQVAEIIAVAFEIDYLLVQLRVHARQFWKGESPEFASVVFLSLIKVLSFIRLSFCMSNDASLFLIFKPFSWWGMYSHMHWVNSVAQIAYVSAGKYVRNRLSLWHQASIRIFICVLGRLYVVPSLIAIIFVLLLLLLLLRFFSLLLLVLTSHFFFSLSFSVSCCLSSSPAPSPFSCHPGVVLIIITLFGCFSSVVVVMVTFTILQLRPINSLKAGSWTMIPRTSWWPVWNSHLQQSSTAHPNEWQRTVKRLVPGQAIWCQKLDNKKSYETK